MLSGAIEFSRCSQGLFDITVGPLVTLWNNGKDVSKPPDESRIRQTLPLVNYADLVLDPREKVAGLQRIGQSIDLGGIGKGFAGGKFLEVFKKYGISSAFTNFPGIEAILVDMSLQVYVTAGLKDCFLAGEGISANKLTES